MAAKHQSTFKDFQPLVETSEEDGCTILAIYVPGFSKEQIRVQVSSKRKLTIFGERPYRNKAKQRFHKEFQIPPNCDTTNITAKYKAGILYVRQSPRPESKPPHTAPTAATIVEDPKNGGVEAYEKVEVKSTSIFDDLLGEILLAYWVAMKREITLKLMKLILAIWVVVLLFMFVKRMNDSNVNP